MTLLTKVVAIADKVTKKLEFQAQVTHYSYASDGGVGAPVYNPTAGTKRDAVVEKKHRQVRSFSGVLTTSNTTVLFVGVVVVKPNDRITLPDGSGGEIIGEGGFVDKGSQVYSEAYLG